MANDRNYGSKLEDIFAMAVPVDVYGTKTLIGSDKAKAQETNFYSELIDTLVNLDARGLYPAQSLVARLDELLTTKNDEESIDEELYNKFLHSVQVYTSIQNNPFLKAAIDREHYSTYIDKSKSMKVQFSHIVGINTNLDGIDSLKKDMCVCLLNSPFFHPSVRNVRNVEIWLNHMPSYVLSRCVPYLDVMFAFDDVPEDKNADSDKLKSASLLKFLNGAVRPDGSADVAINAASTMRKTSVEESKNRQYSTVGMELFTSPQTLINPSAAAQGARYNRVLDPFRPFATLKSVEISVVPTVGFMTYKKATMTIVLHDRSRLTEIADLIRPQVYTNTSLWLTYGWRHPPESDNPYAEFINSNMLMREVYGVYNSSFSFDALGQVEIRLELFTKGIAEIRLLNISDNNDAGKSQLEKISQLSKRIKNLRRQLGLSKREGMSTEVLTEQVLNAAETGTFPDLASYQIKNAIDSLYKSLKEANLGKDKKLSKDVETKIKELQDSLTELYSRTNDPSGRKFNLIEARKNMVTQAISSKFQACINEPDPFLPTEEKFKDVQEPFKPVELLNILNEFHNNKASNEEFKKVTEKTGFQNRFVSFGKIFMTFVSSAVMLLPNVDELQVFFYLLNNNCGPISGRNIAEFPVEMSSFLDQYRAHVMGRGNESVTIEEFLSILINSQLSDDRAIGYGLRHFYEPYNPENRSPALRNWQHQQYESAVIKREKQFGVFRKPVIEMYVETVHARTAKGKPDLLSLFQRQQIDPVGAPGLNKEQSNTKKIIRIHLFDKTVTAHKVEQDIIKAKDGSIGFLDPTAIGKAQFGMHDVYDKYASVDIKKDGVARVLLKDPFTNQEIKEFVRRYVPTILYGANGTTVKSAAVTSQQDQLLGTVQLIKTSQKRNVMQPNGGGLGNLPLRVLPTTLTADVYGCPLLSLAQKYFWDFNTGTTVDNLYILTAMNHRLAPGGFDSNLTFGLADAYGKFEGAQTIINDFINLDRAQDTEDET
jgi:hypothetical protein